VLICGQKKQICGNLPAARIPIHRASRFVLTCPQQAGLWIKNKSVEICVNLWTKKQTRAKKPKIKNNIHPPLELYR